jgi:hypothetical protein
MGAGPAGGSSGNTVCAGFNGSATTSVLPASRTGGRFLSWSAPGTGVSVPRIVPARSALGSSRFSSGTATAGVGGGGTLATEVSDLGVSDGAGAGGVTSGAGAWTARRGSGAGAGGA